ncbi:hypothetical protein OS493_010379 [Desmophyllum pertusum]|uniref:Uncharacterized protein n=1 Tax=Desmophyllum pertusum TaxID=174260 RepID=A0A9X0DAN3_9CNID|nr:hypothetical protein OS493_010379 [Desmophyllum pertusum]
MKAMITDSAVDVAVKQFSGGTVNSFSDHLLSCVGKHSWRVRISVLKHDALVNPSGHGSLRIKCQPSSPLHLSNFTNCMNNDIIGIFNLDCDNKTLVMYNQRTEEFDTWGRLQGEVRPMFEMYCVGDAGFLALLVDV